MVQITTAICETTWLVEVAGELDCTNCDELARALNSSLPGGVRRVVVDFGAVRFCDLATIRIVLEAERQAARHGLCFDVEGARPVIRRMLELVRLGSLA